MRDLQPPISLYRVLFFERLPWRLLILGVGLLGALLGILSPYYQKLFIDGFVQGHLESRWVWAAFATAASAHGLAQLSIWLATRESVVAQKRIGDALYERLVTVRGGVVGNRPVGEAVSIFAVDVPGAAAILDQTLPMGVSFLFPVILAPIALNIYFDIPYLASLTTIACIGAMNLFLARRQSRFFHQFKQLAAERTGLVSEWVQNIRALRILGWVEAAERRIFEVRGRETQNRLAMVTNGQMMNALAGSLTFVLNLFAVLFLVSIRGRSVTSGEILALLWILGVFLMRPLRQFPWVLVIGLDSLSSIRRLQEAFGRSASDPKVIETNEERPTSPELALEIRSLRLQIGGETILEDIDLSVRDGELLAIVGEVGSGKSMLLQSLLGETGATFARFAVFGKAGTGPLDPQIRSQFAFVPQEGFTMSASLRENVVFEYDADRETDEEALHSLSVAQFDVREEGVAQGLDAEIGERGVNLSGGQRQRVGLARAHLVDRPLVLLDDSLSAVDVDTERCLVEELLDGAWKGRTRILTTHRMSVLPRCDRVVMLEKGRIVLEGTYSDLMERSRKFREFVTSTNEKAKRQEGESTGPIAVSGSAISESIVSESAEEVSDA